MARPRPSEWTLARLAVALAGFLPFAHGLASGGSFYFRDLSSYFFPIRRFVVEGLLQGEIRRFNPYVNEGAPVVLPPIAYPLDLLQALAPGPWGFSLLLALHVPIAALCMLALARGLGLRAPAAALAAIAYALSGFSLSCLNLYIHMQAFAWAPLLVLLLFRAATGGAREVALSAAAVALCLSTTGVEITAQAVACAFVLAASRQLPSLLRVAGGTALGAAIAAAPLASLAGLVAGSRREAGFTVAEALELSVHPVSLLQTVVAGLLGDPARAGHAYWGSRFWGGPSPYFLSLYLGGAALCLAALGATRENPRRTRLLLLLGAALVVCLGRFARLDLLLELLPFLAKFRFPVKAFFTVVLACSLLAGAGAERLLASSRPLRPLVGAAALLAAGLLLPSLVESLLPRGFAWLQEAFFSAGYPRELRAEALRSVAADAAIAATALAAVAGLAALALRGRLSARALVMAITAVVAADLVRAGAAVNPMTPASFYELSPEMSLVGERLRQARGRVFTCVILAMPTYREAVQRVERPALWSAAAWRESLSPYTNLDARVPTTGADATALVSTARTLSVGDAMCRDAGALERLRAAGVRFILSVQPFSNEALRLVDVAAPARIAPLRVHVYELEASLPDPSVWPAPDDLDADGRARTVEGGLARYLEDRPGLVRLAVDSPRDGYVILRRTHAPGWRATVDGRPAAVVAANGRHQAVAVAAGTSLVELRYVAPGSLVPAGLGLLGALTAAVLYRRGARPAA